MGKFIKLESDDLLPVYVLKTDVRKVDVVDQDEEEKTESVDVYVQGGDEDVYQMTGPIGFAEKLIAQIEEYDGLPFALSGVSLKSECANCGNTGPQMESES